MITLLRCVGLLAVGVLLESVLACHLAPGALKVEAAMIRGTLPPSAPPTQRLAALTGYFFGSDGFTALSDASAPEGASIAATLRSRRGTCVTLAIIYVEFARKLGLDAHAVAAPDHVFVRVRLPDGPRNVELTEAGAELPNDVYRRRYRLHPASIAAGVFLRDLTDDELLAHLISNQGVALSRTGKFQEALARYDRALRMAPQLQAAWYNRGLDLMRIGRHEDALASFTRAIVLHPNDAQAHNNRGVAHQRLGDAAAARTDWMSALELQPGMKAADENLRGLGATMP